MNHWNKNMMDHFRLAGDGFGILDILDGVEVDVAVGMVTVRVCTTWV